eukprot:691-Heterococcus_DN1.PRE.1
MCSSNGRAVSIAVKRVLPQRSRSCATAHHHITAILITLDLSLCIVVSSLTLHSATRQPFQPYAPSSTTLSLRDLLQYQHPLSTVMAKSVALVHLLLLQT